MKTTTALTLTLALLMLTAGCANSVQDFTVALNAADAALHAAQPFLPADVQNYFVTADAAVQKTASYIAGKTALTPTDWTTLSAMWLQASLPIFPDCSVTPNVPHCIPHNAAVVLAVASASLSAVAIIIAANQPPASASAASVKVPASANKLAAAVVARHTTGNAGTIR